MLIKNEGQIDFICIACLMESPPCTVINKAVSLRVDGRGAQSQTHNVWTGFAWSLAQQGTGLGIAIVEKQCYGSYAICMSRSSHEAASWVQLHHSALA